MGAQHGELHQIGRVEQHIGVFLERIYPLDLGPAHIRPVGDRFPGREGTLEVVPHDPSQQAVVACRDTVVAVQRDGGDGVYEYPEFFLLRHLVREAWVQGVKSLDQQHRPFAKPEVLAVELPAACDEVIFRNLNLLAVKEFDKVFLEIFMIHGVEIVEVVASVRQFWRVHPVDEVVVRGERDRVQAARLQLDAEPLADRAFSAAARPGDQHELDRILRIVVPPFNLLCDLYYLLLLQCLRNLDQVRGVAFQDRLIDIPDIRQPHYPVPFVSLGEDLEGLRLLDGRRQILRMVAVRDTQQYSSVAEPHTEGLKVAGARNQLVVVIVRHILKGVAGDVDLAARLQQLHLVVVAGLFEYPDGFLDLYLLAPERNVGLDNLSHPRSDGIHVGLRQS